MEKFETELKQLKCSDFLQSDFCKMFKLPTGDLLFMLFLKNILESFSLDFRFIYATSNVNDISS